MARYFYSSMGNNEEKSKAFLGGRGDHLTGCTRWSSQGMTVVKMESLWLIF
ncbi:MAG: hypothetical protein KME32_35975 [Mojavia pulchra JT2-VF2]|jgi:hypothetical protein|uniref:Uncharacterized protein n=1 Tax=Mojavia pulchra JT2-VF2 TaxID=287848 RepID=A0A951UKH1_9NOST|nr:hypothetical protein [Mojavia pulchra JT2-VF2]